MAGVLDRARGGSPLRRESGGGAGFAGGGRGQVHRPDEAARIPGGAPFADIRSRVPPSVSRRRRVVPPGRPAHRLARVAKVSWIPEQGRPEPLTSPLDGIPVRPIPPYTAGILDPESRSCHASFISKSRQMIPSEPRLSIAKCSVGRFRSGRARRS